MTSKQREPLQRRKILVFRLSSLGDLVLASVVLAPGILDGPVDWVVSSELATLLEGHPNVRRLWAFDRSKGLRGWLELCAQLKQQGYTHVYDLHSSLRTKIARMYFGLSGGNGAVWRAFSKERWRLYGLFLFKRFWPAKLRPRPFVGRFAKFVGGSGAERPNLSHLLAGAQGDLEFQAWVTQKSVRSFFGVMPSSRWSGKCWPTSKYLEVIQAAVGREMLPVVFGSSRDRESRELVLMLEKAKIEHFSGVGRWDLKQVAWVLSQTRAYLGNDTGLAHLAESLGVPALTVYGPTSTEMGFGPWRAESQAFERKNLGCRPCGKDGRRCYRLKNKYCCLTELSSAGVIEGLVRLGQSASEQKTKSTKAEPKGSSTREGIHS